MKIGLVSLGCPKNLVDSEVMLGLAQHAGHHLTADPASADVIVVNTCAFIDSAKQESIDAILEMARHKTEGRCQRLVVTGCLAERYRDTLRKEIPEIDAVLGTGEVPEIVNAWRHRDCSGRGTTHVLSSPEPRFPSPELRTAFLYLRRGYAASACDTPALRLHQDCRRVRLQVRVLHYPDAPWALSLAPG
jgi:tRNA A37 methylthiotransferase MiaB